MKKNEKYVKKVKPFPVKVLCFFVVIIFAFLWSCSSDDKDSTSVVLEEPELNTPIIQSPTPLIYLADNLDEQDQLGWCIDTQGNGFSENLHTHSCKPTGGDVQFFYNAETLQICSVEFAGFCIEMVGGPLEGMSLNLIESNTDSSDQKFIYDENSGEFNPEANTNLCLAVGDTSGVAGIYMFRSLTLEVSSETEESLKKWVIVNN